MNVRSWTMASLAVVVLGSSGLAWWLYDAKAGNALPAGIVLASGRLEGREVRVGSEAGGRVLALNVERGDSVVQDQVLAEIDQRTVAAVVDGAQAALAAAHAAVAAADANIVSLQAQRDLATTEAASYRRLFEHDAIARQTVDQAEAQLKSLDGQLAAARAERLLALRRTEAARAQVATAEVQLAEATLHAPVAGHVRAVIARAGEVVPPASPIVELVTTDPMRLRLYLPYGIAARIRAGAEARVYSDAYPDRVFAGVVERIASEAEFTPQDIHMPDERSALVFAVDVRVANADGALKDGFPADAYVRWDRDAAWPERRPW